MEQALRASEARFEALYHLTRMTEATDQEIINSFWKNT
jgi:hypothetical protein